ncbi:hypothetical protein CDAR_68751 [Caerostris darwini]|uniref:Uncharacterized protein n=1 Tax=Caerostris darwini TaxID=1538125 RepID=A0AAV4WXJ7_9ARAC|nr:hypothetical protein CDAR_68751 [Caerostris darwini]
MSSTECLALDVITRLYGNHLDVQHLTKRNFYGYYNHAKTYSRKWSICKDFLKDWEEAVRRIQFVAVGKTCQRECCRTWEGWF